MSTFNSLDAITGFFVDTVRETEGNTQLRPQIKQRHSQTGKIFEQRTIFGENQLLLTF